MRLPSNLVYPFDSEFSSPISSALFHALYGTRLSASPIRRAFRGLLRTPTMMPNIRSPMRCWRIRLARAAIGFADTPRDTHSWGGRRHACKDYDISSIRSMGRTALCMISSGSSISNPLPSNASRTSSRVTFFIFGHTILGCNP